jgi:large subunit ribosomal protein L25
MQTIKIAATRRNQLGKGPARRLRAGGQIPATAYGRGHQTASLVVSPRDMQRVLGSEHGRNSVIEIDLEGDRFTVLLKDYQYHPLTRELLHADFARISLDAPVDVEVPLELTGKAEGVVQGGVLRQIYRRLPVRCLPEKIPVKLTRDVTAMKLGDHVYAEQLELPEGVAVRLPPKQTVCAVVIEKVKYEEEEAAAAAAAPGAAGAPAEGAPAPGAEAAPAGTEKKAGAAEKKAPEKK